MTNEQAKPTDIKTVLDTDCFLSHDWGSGRPEEGADWFSTEFWNGRFACKALRRPPLFSSTFPAFSIDHGISLLISRKLLNLLIRLLASLAHVSLIESHPELPISNTSETVRRATNEPLVLSTNMKAPWHLQTRTTKFTTSYRDLCSRCRHGRKQRWRSFGGRKSDGEPPP